MVEILSTCLAVLGPEIKIFIMSVLIVGPLCIIGILLLLKKIQNANPERIRWR